MLEEITPAELMEWQAYVRLEAEEMEGRVQSLPERPPDDDPAAVAQRGWAVQKRLAAWRSRRQQTKGLRPPAT